jgi:hypothetical protein
MWLPSDRYSDDLVVNHEDLRKIIRGECIIKKCPDCQGDGNIYLHYTSDDDEPKQVSRQFYDEWNHDEDRDDGQSVESERCETCHGVGYTVVES